MPQPEWMPRGGPPWATAGGSPRTGMPRPVRLWLPVAVSFFVQVPATVFLSWHAHRAALPLPTSQMLFAIGLALLGPVVLVWARRFPGPVVAVAAAAASADLLVDPVSGPPYIALAFAIVLGIIRGAAVWVFVSVAAAWVVTLIGAVLLGTGIHPAQIIALTLGVLICIGIGQAIRGRRERFTAMRQESARRRVDAAQAERVRIARELHDVLAHSLSQINVQAGVGLHLIDRQPEKAAEALASIKLSSKVALDDVRSVLGILRDESADAQAPLLPQPDLSRLPALVEQVGHDGPRVTLLNEIRMQPAGAVQMAIYRMVQESLTNVVRHAGATEVVVHLTEGDGEYVMTVADDGVGPPAGAGEAGRGILGMRERAELLGGTLEAGSPGEQRPAGRPGFRVLARIPTGWAR